MDHSLGKLARTGFALILALTLTAFPAVAQQQMPEDHLQQSKNPLQRIFYSDYRAPLIRSFETGREASLESMIREGRLELSVDDAVRLALENNVDINVERYGPYFALWGLEKGRGVLNPSASFSSNVSRMVAPTSSALQGGTTLFNLNNLYDVTLRKPFEAGTDLDLNFNTRRNRTNSFFTSLNPSLTTSWSISLTQHLLKDGGRISRGRFLRIARNNREISEEVFVARVTDIVNSVVTAYWDLVFGEEDVKLKEASLELARLVLEQNRIQAEVGSMAALDVVQAEAEVASRNQQWVVAKFNRKIQEDQLKKLISSRQDPGRIAADIAPLSRPAAPPPQRDDLGSAIESALENRPEVKQQRLEIENRKIQVDFTRNQLKPVLDIVASYSQNGLGGDRLIRDTSQGFFNAPVIAVLPGGFGDTLDSLFSQKYLGYTLGFNFRVPLGNDDARASNAQAQIEHRQAEERYRSLRQRIALEVRQAFERMELNRASAAAAEVTVRYQQQRLQGEQDKYSLGATTTRAVIEAQRDLQSAQTTLLQARIELVKSRIAMDKALGETFSAHGIELKEALQASVR